jgi:hypothetical protein
MLAALPDGAYYLVPHRPLATHCERLLAQAGRARNAIRFVTADLRVETIMGVRPSAWGVDHSYFDIAGSRGTRAYAALWLAAGKGPASAE